MAAAEGSFERPSTSNPAARAASSVRKRWLLLALAGTPEHHLKRLRRLRPQGRGVQQILAKRRHHLHENLREVQRMTVDRDFGVRAGVFEKPLERANDGPTRLALQLQGFPAIQTAVAGDGQNGRKPVVHAPAGRFEIHQGIVAAIDGGNHDAGRTKIEANSHGTNIVRLA